MSEIDRIRTEFLERVSAMAHAEHMPPISGRIFGLLVFDGGPIAFGDLAERLNVSRASISTAARVLEEHGLICRLKRPGQRGDFFDIQNPPYQGLFSGILQRAHRAEESIRDAIEALPSTEAERRARLSDFGEFYTALQICASMALDQLTGDSRP